MQKLKFRRIAGVYAVCRIPADSAPPSWALAGTFHSITHTSDELSIVCDERDVPPDVKAERGWACLKLEGPFPFSMTGVLASFLEPLAQYQISIVAVSTFDTDYVLVKQTEVERALEALRQAGHEFLG